MNQDDIKQLLLNLDPSVPDFHVLFTGKASKRVNGLYKPASFEILIHNKNFNSKTELIYTAIHEFAHHIQFAVHELAHNSRAHSSLFRSIFHELLLKAETKNLYQNPLFTNSKLQELSKKIAASLLPQHSKMILELGQLLMEAAQICQEQQLPFDDYLARILHLNKNTAANMMQLANMNINPELGPDRMRLSTKIANPAQRKSFEENVLANNLSPDKARELLGHNETQAQQKVANPRKQLEEEARRISRSINKMEERLEQISLELEKLSL